MDQEYDRLYPSLENIDLEQRLKKKLNDVISFNDHINNIKEIITNFKNRSINKKTTHKNYKTLNTMLESVDSIVILAATSTSITF